MRTHCAHSEGMAKWSVMKRFLLSSFSLLILLAFPACSNFDARFAKGVQGTRKDDQFSGTYAGRWMSSSHPGGGGNLRCILTRLNDSDYRADFHATWHGFASEHVVVLHTTPLAKKKPAMSKSGQLTGGSQLCADNERYVGGSARDFEGTSKLRTIIGAGTYSCRGWLKQFPNTVSMCACYDATYDKGAFQLHRIVSHGAAH